MNLPGNNSVELKVKVININADKAHKILKKCGILREYSQFIDTVRKYSSEKGAIKKAIKECIDSGILAEYLKRKGSEVENMLIAEYSYEEDIQVKQQEARQQGMALGRQQGMALGRQQGMALGRQQGMIQGTICTLRDFGHSDMEIQGMIMEKYGLSIEEAEEYLRKAF